MPIPPTTRRFKVTDSAGRERTLVLIQPHRHGDGNFEGESAVVKRLMKFQTVAGALVNRVEKGVYQIAMTGEILRSDHPDAP